MRHYADRSKQQQQLGELYGNAVSDDEKRDIIAKRNALNSESLEYIDKLIADNSHLYVSKFI